MPLVSVKKLTLKMGHKTILQDVDLEVNSKEIVTLIGPNGAGKSTLAKIILGLLSPTIGKVYKKPGIRMGYMPQKITVEPWMPLSVMRFLQLVGTVEKKQFQSIVDHCMVGHLLASTLSALSGGELQRVLLTRALLRQPNLLVLDEPVQGVDLTGQEEFYRLILHIREVFACGILMVSHDLHMVMAGTDSVICLNKHVCCSGHPAMVSQHPEFLNLFSSKTLDQFAVYRHHHNHKHDLGGEICS